MTLHYVEVTINQIDSLIELLSHDEQNMSQLFVKIAANGRVLTDETCKSIYKLYIRLGQVRPDVDLRVNVESLKGRTGHVPQGALNIVFDQGVSVGDVAPAADAPLLKQVNNVVLGGTFDRLHVGHKILLTEAVVRCSNKLTVGVTDHNMITSKKLWELIEPVERRIERVRDFLQHIDGGLVYDVIPIADMFGPTQTDPHLDLIVVSAETEKGGLKVNEVRKERGMKELIMHVVELVQAESTAEADEHKISSSNQRLRLLGTMLRPPEPKPDLPPRPYLIGLTGGIASGKSNVGRVLAGKGAGLIDCDKVAHTLYKKNTSTYHALVDMFGSSIVSNDGEINRRALGDIVFNSKDELLRLNSLLWPCILSASVSEAHRLYREEGLEVVVLEAAVLLQAGWHHHVHQVWTCIIPPREAVERVMKRNNISESAASARVAAQPSNTEQLDIANIVFCSLYSYEYTHGQVNKAWAALQRIISPKVIPVLDSSLHKGMCGRIGVIGGSLEYTGAPYFAAISALRTGADLVHVFCSQSAAPVIKSYSPELIVHPLLDTQNAVEDISFWLARLHALVIGPGLGRNPEILKNVRTLISRTPKIPIVLDADGIFIMSENPEFFKNFPRPLIVTPNAVEISRLPQVHLPGVVYLEKGEIDTISYNDQSATVSEPGSNRRCGGQGDVLSGVLGVFAAWTYLAKSEDYMSASGAASTLTRRCSNRAFQIHKRSMLASNLIEALPTAFQEIFETDGK